MLDCPQTLQTRPQRQPGPRSLFTEATFLADRAPRRRFARASGTPLVLGLDVGGSSQPGWSRFLTCHSTGLDIDKPRSRHPAIAETLCSGHRFPLGEVRLDSVASSQVLEHEVVAEAVA